MKRLKHRSAQSGASDHAGRKGARPLRSVLASLCAVAMSLGMASASVAAFADDRQPAATADPQAATASAGNVDAPQHTKRISKNDDGTYTLSMDVTGKSDESTEQQVVPLDIALGLDVSGSMNELSGKLV